MNDLGQVLRARRATLRLTLRQVEKRTGVSNAYLSQVENGRIRQPSPTVLDKLAQAYELAYADLMGLAGYPSPEPSKQAARHGRSAAAFNDLTDDEEVELREYLTFLRSRRRR